MKETNKNEKLAKVILAGCSGMAIFIVCEKVLFKIYIIVK